MRKFLIAALVFLTATPALADWRRERHAPPRYQHHYRGGNSGAWIAGGLALGALGAYALTHRPYCRDQYLVDEYGNQLYNRYGQPLFQRMCD
jgi:hypothetical protein